MSDNLVLIIGASGHMGYRAVINALVASYKVRAAVGSQSKAVTILAAASTEVPAPGVKDVEYILHIASPIAFEGNVITSAVTATTGNLRSALRAPIIERIVLTSSIIAVMPWNYFIRDESKIIFTADDRNQD